MAKIDLQNDKNFSVKEFLLKHKFIWVFSLLVALIAGFYTWWGGEKYSVSLALTITRSGTQQAIDYKYDSFYALEATDQFGDTVAGWFKTPEIASVISKKVGDDQNNSSLNNLSKRFQASKISPNLVEVRYGAADETSAKRLAEAVGQVISEKVNLINNSSNQGISFAAISGEPVIVRNTYNIWLSVLAGFLIGLVFGFFIQVAKEYFK